MNNLDHAALPVNMICAAECITAHVSPNPSGVRAYDRTHSESLAYAQSFGGLPDGLNRWTVANALRRPGVAAAMGVSRGAVELFTYYTELTRDCDWEGEGRGPVAFPSQETAAAKLNVSVPTIYRYEHDLLGAGLIAIETQTNGKRHGRRVDGELKKAFGVNLCPSVRHHGRMVAAAEHHKAQEEARELASADYRVAHNDVLLLMRGVRAGGALPTDAAARHEGEIMDRWSARRRKSFDPAAAATATRALARYLRSLIEPVDNSGAVPSPAVKMNGCANQSEGLSHAIPNGIYKLQENDRNLGVSSCRPADVEKAPSGLAEESVSEASRPADTGGVPRSGTVRVSLGSEPVGKGAPSVDRGGGSDRGAAEGEDSRQGPEPVERLEPGERTAESEHEPDGGGEPADGTGKPRSRTAGGDTGQDRANGIAARARADVEREARARAGDEAARRERRAAIRETHDRQPRGAGPEAGAVRTAGDLVGAYVPIVSPAGPEPEPGGLPSLDRIAAAMPERMRRDLPNGIDMIEFIDAAAAEAKRLGVSAPAWQDACREVGRATAALAIAAIAAKVAAGVVRSPGGYFRGCIRKAVRKEPDDALNLSRSLWGVVRASEERERRRRHGAVHA